MKDWKEKARRTIEGDKIELKSLKDGWFQPRKYSIEGSEVIRSLTVKTGMSLSSEMLKKLAPYIESDDSPEEIMKKLPPADLEMLMKSQAVGGQSNKELVGAILTYGIGTNNLEGENIVEDLLEYSEIAMEMIEGIRKHNRPLAPGTAKK